MLIQTNVQIKTKHKYIDEHKLKEECSVSHSSNVYQNLVKFDGAQIIKKGGTMLTLCVLNRTICHESILQNKSNTQMAINS